MMLADKIRESLIKFRDKLLDSPFRGIDERLDEIQYNQKWLEDHVHTRPAGDGYDYCFVWCLCFAYANLIANKSWEEIANALAQVSEKQFNHISGYVYSVSGLTHELGKLLGVPYYIDRVASCTIGEDFISKINDYRLANKLGIDYFLMSAYKPEHYMFVSHSGVEINPYPDYHGEFIGFRVYQFYKMGL